MKRASPAWIGAVSSGILVAVAAICLTGCSFFSPAVQPVGSGQGFHERQFPLDTEYISVGTPGQEQYRVFDPNTDELANAEQAASAFCERHGKAINLLEITTFAPSRSLLDLLCVLCTYPGPAAEIIFECI